jgi:hypothetical protein
MDNILAPLSDLATPAKARKIRAPKHDFQNGEGKVFAHRHSNGNGWVADTAHVAESVKVASGCSVYGYARVTDGVTLSGKAQIGDRARVMHNVTLSGATIVRGSALVRDNARLTERTFVAGSAQISGNTFSQGKVHISDFALVHNSRLNGPRASYHIEIHGNAKVFDSCFTGPCFAYDSVILQNAHMNFAGCAGQGMVVNSTVNTSPDSQIVSYAYPGGSRQRRMQTQEPALATVPPLTNRLLYVRGLIMNTRMHMRPCEVNPDVYLLNCILSLYYQDLPDSFTEFPAGAVDSLNVNSVRELVERYQRGSVTTAITAAIPTIASIGVVPGFDQVRQRRIMRMEETKT